MAQDDFVTILPYKSRGQKKAEMSHISSQYQAQAQYLVSSHFVNIGFLIFHVKTGWNK